MAKNLLDLIPTKVRITKDISYEIVYVDSFENPHQVGECRPDTKQILLKKHESKTETFKTYIHESLHAINFETKDLNLTEKQTSKLEDGIYRLLKLNKLL